MRSFLRMGRLVLCSCISCQVVRALCDAGVGLACESPLAKIFANVLHHIKRDSKQMLKECRVTSPEEVV